MLKNRGFPVCFFVYLFNNAELIGSGHTNPWQIRKKVRNNSLQCYAGSMKFLLLF